MKDKKISTGNKIIIIIAIIVSIIIIGFAIFNNKSKVSSNVSGAYDKFAQCLTDKGAVMYGAEWCSHCKVQKAAFGDSFRLIKYVECPDNTQLCIDKGVQGYPTWLIGTSTKLEGFDENKTMKELSDATGCPLP
jgi:hypothetical protein